MIRHIVILHFKKDLHSDYYALMCGTKSMILQIPGVISYEIFENESKYTPHDVLSLGVEIIFEDESALDTFMEHPKHYDANALFEKYLADPGYMVLTHSMAL
jgi:hypothetical protein